MAALLPTSAAGYIPSSAAQSFNALTFKNPAWDERVDYSAALDCMQHGEIVFTCPMREFLEERKKGARFNNEVHYGIIQYRNESVAVVFKPKKEDEASVAYAEQVAYRIYEELITPFTGNHFIPPTIVRQFIDGRTASCQFFVETGDEEDMWNPAFRESVFQAAPHDIVQELSVFNSVFNNWDRHPGNYLATNREGRFHLASIDNEAVENRGLLPNWGERSYVPALFTQDQRAIPQQRIQIENNVTLPAFQELLTGYGFQTTPRMTIIFQRFAQGGEARRVCYIQDGALSVRYHQGNKAAFPLPKAPYSPLLVAVYKQLTHALLEESMRPLIECDPKRFASRVPGILERRDLFINSLNPLVEPAQDLTWV